MHGQKYLKSKNVKVIPDGSGNFTRYMGMLIGKNHRGFGNPFPGDICVLLKMVL